MDTSRSGPQPLPQTGSWSGPTGTDDQDGPQKESHGEGTGEKWVKSSGMKADGGDFDASAPGAGREADREFFSSLCTLENINMVSGLLDDKGVHRTADPSKDEDGKKADPSGDKFNKPSLGDKIKAKLHLDHRNKSDRTSGS